MKQYPLFSQFLGLLDFLQDFRIQEWLVDREECHIFSKFATVDECSI